MQLHRVVPMLQSVAQVRNWLVEHIPLTESLLGYDLFLKLGNDIAAGLTLNPEGLARGLPYPPEQVLEQLERMVQAGLLVLEGQAPGPRTVRPTPHFLALLGEYTSTFDSLFIVREDLRSQQFVAAGSDPALNAFGKLVYDHIYDLGWIYLHNFGSVCFLMASLMRRVAVAHGHEARIASCYVDIAADSNNRYLLGAQGMAKPGQIDGHAVCVVDEAMILDFGLGNVRKGYRRDFAWGVVCDFRRDGAVMGSMSVPTGESVTWRDDWQSPDTDNELARYAPFIEQLFGEYASRFL